jgi:hypothetical protein
MSSRTFVFCTSHVITEPENNTLNRYKAWIDHYLPMLGELNADKLFLIDDGGSDCTQYINVIEGDLPDTLLPSLNMYRFSDKLGRNSPADFPGWWRSFFFALQIARKYGYRKMVHIESDFFVLSPQLRQFIRDVDHGWSGVYSSYYKFPETSLQVICEDSFDRLAGIRDEMERSQYRTKIYAELLIPFTSIKTEFTGDRFGEAYVLADWILHRPDRLSRLDYIAQVSIL